VTDEILPGGGVESPKPTLVERLFGGDWRTAAIVAGPTVLVAFVLGLVATSYLIWVDAGGDEDFDLLAHSNAGFFRSAFAITGMAFGSPAFLSGGKGSDHVAYQAGMAPLTITLLTALVFVFLLRRYDAVGTFAERIDLALRAALLTAIGLALLTIGMYATQHLDGDTVHQSGSPGRTFGWSLLLFVAAAVVATVRSWDLSEDLERLWGKWRLPVLGAVVAIVTAVVLSGITGIVIILAQADSGLTDVVKALPILFVYLVNLGVDVFQIAVGGALRAASGGDGSSVSLFDRHGLSAAYFFLLLLPPIAITVGISWIRRHAGDTSRQEVARACYRMSVPAAVLWLLVAIPSRTGFSIHGNGAPGGASGHAGVQVLLGTLIVFGWFLVLGYVIGQWWLPRDLGMQTPPRAPGWFGGALNAGPLAIVVGIVGVVIAAGGVATAKDGAQTGDFGPVSGLVGIAAFGFDTTSDEGASFSTESGSASSNGTGAQSFTSDGSSEAEAQVDLRVYVTAEETYYADHQTYTADPAELTQLSFGVTSGTVAVIRADSSSYCLETFTDNGPYTYDSNVGDVVPGATC
jgi:hypothetical protein